MKALYLEHCPECEAAVECPPLSLVTVPPNSVDAQYRCPVCLFSWRTGWLREPTNQEPR